MQKKIWKNLLLVVIMTVLCVAVGMTASASNYEDIWTQGFATEEQVVLVFDLNGGKIDGTVENFNLETMSFETVTELSGKYVMIPKNETEQVEGSNILFPSIIAPEYHRMKGWHLDVQNIIYAPGSRYKIPISTAGTVIEFTALYEDYTPYNFVDGVLTAGENLTWYFDETTGTLEISGEGEMYDFDGVHYYLPWGDLNNDIRRVTISEGVTTIGDSAFLNCHYIENIALPEGLVNINDEAFAQCISLKELKLPESLVYIGLNALTVNVWIKELVIPKNVKKIDELALVYFLFCDKIYIKSMDTEFGFYSLNVSDFVVNNLSKDLCFDYIKRDLNGDVNAWNEFMQLVTRYDDIVHLSTIYCHAGSTAEAYAIENGMDYVLTHFFEGEWIYDYDNMIRYRKCIHCDELETEPLESTGDSDVEIIEPVDPDTDFVVDEITDYVIIEEALSNGVAGDFEIVKAFDITMTGKDGVHVQPDGTVKVKLPLDWSKDGVYKVYRVNDDGTLTDMNAYRQGSHMVFDTDHFSIYVIVDESEKTDEPITPDEPQEETKDNFFTKLLNLIKSFFDLIMSWFKK